MNWHEQPTGRLMILAFRQFEEQLLRQLHHRGFIDISLSHLNIIRHLDDDGLSIVQLAREAGISKQGASKITAELVRKNYVTVLTEPRDGRAKRVEYTPRGAALVTEAVDIVKLMEKAYLTLLGDTYHDLRKGLNQIYQYHRKEAP